jgi:hypothetical protein
MNSSDFLLILFLFGAGSIFGIIASLLSLALNHWIINQIFAESFFRNGMNLFLVFVSSFLGTMIGFIGVIGFAADENAGEIFPYYTGISLLVSILCTIIYYFIKVR